MIIFSDPQCLQYHSRGHPEGPSRIESTVSWLRQSQPDWEWQPVEKASEAALARAHPQSHLQRLEESRDFDADTAFHPGIFEIARLGTGAALAATNVALAGGKAFSLMRPPGHHAEADRAMGFCYLNHVAIAALDALDNGAERVAVWDFDAHHGNGTEAILDGVAGTLYVSVHQHPCYPGTGTRSRGNLRNYPIPPGTPSPEHMAVLADSWAEVVDFRPDLVLVSAGFDAYAGDPLTDMRLEQANFATLGEWINQSKQPAAALLEGGYSDDLPLLVEAFLKGWSGL